MNNEQPNQSPIDAQMAAPPSPPPVEPTGPTYRPPAGREDLLQNRAAVLTILFLVTGVLGVPLLWINRNFSTAERIFWTIVVTIYTAVLIGFVGWIIVWAYGRIFVT